MAFYEENQGVYCWVISSDDTGKPDPPIATYFSPQNVSLTSSRLSTFLVFLLLEQAIAQSPCWGSYGEASVREVQNCTQDWLCFQGDNHFGAVKHKAAIHLHPTDETAKGRLEVGCHLVGDALRLREIPGVEFEDIPAEWPEADELW